jgi:fatty-acyl-CoA synthase
MDLFVHDILNTTASRVPSRPAVSYRDTRLTYAELHQRAGRVAAALTRRGLGPGTRIAWWGTAGVDVAPLFFGVVAAGAAFVPLNPKFTGAEAAGVIAMAAPDILVTDDEHEGDVTLAGLLSEPAGQTVVPGPSGEQDTAAIFYTSGTTGVSKGVVLSHRCIRLRASTLYAGTGSSPQTTIFPPFHFGGWGTYLAAWLHGGEACYIDAGDTGNILDTVHRHRVSRLYAIPAIWRRMIETPGAAQRLATLTDANTGTSAVNVDLLQDIEALVPQARTSVSYGSTETGGLCSLPHEDRYLRHGSVGLPIAGNLFRRVEGELWVRNCVSFDGYFRNPEATAEVVVDGWYRTGDLVEVDDDGYYWVTGRAKDVMRTGGETVAPGEVEEALRLHHAVRDVAVAGVPDPAWGELVTAFVVVEPGQSVSLEDLREFCAARLAAYKHPRKLVLVEDLPRTEATGKVQRARLLAKVSA